MLLAGQSPRTGILLLEPVEIRNLTDTGHGTMRLLSPFRLLQTVWTGRLVDTAANLRAGSLAAWPDHTFFTNSDLMLIAPMPSILQSIS